MLIRTLATLVFLSTSNLAFSNSSIRENNQLISAGDDLRQVYQLWGQPSFSVRSQKPVTRLQPSKNTNAQRLAKFGYGMIFIGWCNTAVT